MTIPAFEDRAPDAAHVTDYDERHHHTYWRLLDAAAENADWREAAAIIFGIDPEADDSLSGETKFFRVRYTNNVYNIITYEFL